MNRTPTAAVRRPKQPARPVAGDMRLPLPLTEMRACIEAKHGSLVATIVASGVERDDLWSMVWCGFLARQPYNPARMDSPAAWVQAVSRSVLLSILERRNEPMRCPGGRADHPHDRADAATIDTDSAEDVEQQVLDLLDLADTVGVGVDEIAALGLGWTAVEIASGLGMDLDQLRDRLRSLLEARC